MACWYNTVLGAASTDGGLSFPPPKLPRIVAAAPFRQEVGKAGTGASLTPRTSSPMASSAISSPRQPAGTASRTALACSARAPSPTPRRGAPGTARASRSASPTPIAAARSRPGPAIRSSLSRRPSARSRGTGRAAPGSLCSRLPPTGRASPSPAST
jgi:hypothetical protein